MTKSVLSAEIETERCRLVPMDPRHTDHVVRWRNDPESKAFFLSQANISPASHESWLAKQKETGCDFNWVIEERKSGPIGALGLYNIEWDLGRAEFGRLIIGEKSALGRGYAKEAVAAVLSLAGDVELKSIYLRVKEENARAQVLYTRLGFVEEESGPVKMMMKRIDRVRLPAAEAIARRQ